MKRNSASSPLLSVLSVLLFLGCGGAPDGPVDSGTGDVDAGLPDAGNTAPNDACELASEPCTVNWNAAEPYPTRVDHHTAFAHTSTAGTFVFVTGGVSANSGNVTEVFASVRRARVNEDGSLGAWEELSDLPRPVAFHAMTLSGDRVYLVAGITQGPASHKGTLIGELDADGNLSWRVGANVPEALLHPSTQVIGNRLYVIGGSGTMMDAKPVVYVSQLDDTGMNGEWTAAPSLPEPRSHHLTVVRGERIYAVGGLRADMSPIEDVLRSVHDAEGVLTGWESAGTMENAPWTAAGFVRGEWLYVLGGGEGGMDEEKYVGRVRRGHFDPQGLLSSGFEDVETPLPLARAHVHHVPVVNGNLYSVGGRNSSWHSIDGVYVGTMAAE